MRKGVNPEKCKNELNQRFSHRIVAPVYIPNTSEEYYKNALEVLNAFLNSLTNSIDPKYTAITIINNNSIDEVDELIKKYNSSIDKVVNYKENKGKVYPVLSEVRSAYETFVTITDSDVFFFKGWEKEVFKIFNAFPKCGVVAPLPSQGSALYHNCSLFFDNFFKNIIKYDKVVSDSDCKLFTKGLGNEALLRRNNRKYDWSEKQYFIEKPVKVVVGAGHFVATYRTELFRGETDFPIVKFRNGYESEFIDWLSDKKGFYRLSTVETYAYHLGNKLDSHIELPITNDSGGYDFSIQQKIPRNLFIFPYTLKKIIFKFLYKYKKL